MEPIPETSDLSAYLAADEAIDHHHPVVRETAARLRGQAPALHDYAKAAFEFVRDTIPHSQDSGDMRVTWRASDVLELRTGICYAKSHALAALLRAGAIPTGLCYQRLDGVVHGLVAVRMPGHDRWARQDPRGNKPGVNARFSLTEERLAWIPDAARGEMDYPAVYAATPAPVLECLRRATDRPHLWRLLPAGL
jgi:transglutaminase-like putative cysteine protease